MTDAENSTAPEAAETAASDDTATRPDVDWKSRAREWESKAKANKTAAEELAALKAAQMTEQERLTAQLAEVTQSAAAARLEAMRYRVATQYGISQEDAEEFLFGDDEETLTRKAQRFVERTQIPSNPRPAGDADLGASRQTAMPLNGDPLLNDLKLKLGIT